MRKIYWMGLLATMLLGACSDDEELNSGNSGSVSQDGQAYLTVRISDAGANTRAEGDPEFEYGSDAEHAVSDAQFYFYNDKGTYVSKASAWNGGSEVTGDPVGNIEFNSNTIVVLRGLKGKDFPKYMVTVLNAPATTTFDPETDGKSLAEMEKALSGGIYKNGTNGNFIMSITSYKREDATRNNSSVPTYFVTELEPKNFHEEPVDNQDAPVDVYVERLAAKVTLKVSDKLGGTSLSNGETIYQLENVTIAGEDNNGGVTDGTTNTPAEGSTKIYMKINGWALNATAKDSYLMKNIDESWTKDAASGLGFAWNDEDRFRSYWGMSYNYNDEATNYPSENTSGIMTVPSGCRLDYISAEEATIEIGKSAYCAENTFPAEIAKIAAARTSILLSATLCDEEGAALNLVRYNGLLFNEEDYLSYVLNALEADLNSYYVRIDDTSYRGIDKSDVELVDNSDGKVKVQLKESVTLYTKSEETYTEVTDKTLINTTLANFNKDNVANGYKGGLMYYNIPIEHLRTFEANQTDPKEGNYGVVRNHHYVVTINKLENIGKGIYDPDEVIVPSDEDEEVYYVGASIHILSWRLVEQGVEL